MQQIVGVTELQRKFSAFFDQVVNKKTPIVLTRGSHPEAVLIPYQEYLQFQAMRESEVLAQFNRVWERLSTLNADVDEVQLAADIEAARSEA